MNWLWWVEIEACWLCSKAVLLQQILVDLPTKIRRGGQSKNRYARLYNEKVHRYLLRVAETAIEHCTSHGVPSVKGIILAGSVNMKERLASHSAFDSGNRRQVVGLGV